VKIEEEVPSVSYYVRYSMITSSLLDWCNLEQCALCVTDDVVLFVSSLDRRRDAHVRQSHTASSRYVVISSHFTYLLYCTSLLMLAGCHCCSVGRSHVMSPFTGDWPTTGVGSRVLLTNIQLHWHRFLPRVSCAKRRIIGMVLTVVRPSVCLSITLYIA